MATAQCSVFCQLRHPQSRFCKKNENQQRILHFAHQWQEFTEETTGISTLVVARQCADPHQSADSKDHSRGQLHLLQHQISFSQPESCFERFSSVSPFEEVSAGPSIRLGKGVQQAIPGFLTANFFTLLLMYFPSFWIAKRYILSAKDLILRNEENYFFCECNKLFFNIFKEYFNIVSFLTLLWIFFSHTRHITGPAPFKSKALTTLLRSSYMTFLFSESPVLFTRSNTSMADWYHPRLKI